MFSENQNLRKIKDYYQILKLSHKASNDEVKKSYHQLALAYHPDKNPDNALSEEYFMEIQEAYTVLSKPEARLTYDRERQLAGFDKPHKKGLSPDQLLHEIQRISTDVRRMTAYRIDTSWLKYTLIRLGSTQNIAILLEEGWPSLREAYLEDFLWLLTFIPYPYKPEIIINLKALTSKETMAAHQFILFLKSQKRKNLLRKLVPVTAVAVTFALCFFMYYFGKI